MIGYPCCCGETPCNCYCSFCPSEDGSDQEGRTPKAFKVVISGVGAATSADVGGKEIVDGVAKSFPNTEITIPGAPDPPGNEIETDAINNPAPIVVISMAPIFSGVMVFGQGLVRDHPLPPLVKTARVIGHQMPTSITWIVIRIVSISRPVSIPTSVAWKAWDYFSACLTAVKAGAGILEITFTAGLIASRRLSAAVVQVLIFSS